MKPETQREEALFQAADQLTGPARTAFLDGACHGDPALRQRLDALLAAHEASAGVLADEPAREALAPTLDMPEPVPDEAVGMTLGRYKLREKLGEGGCGTVYVAEQTEPVRRKVALKVIKLGMDTREVIARFEAERQALAMMDHPNIAKVLDAGTTDAGRPYFVMELVRGIRITDYCDQANLSTKERLDLFIKVCQAIQHAHQKGIIHRDIKPGNILVTLHDGVPVPKVIDFGIAKATEGRLTDATVYTQLHQFMGTPAYMSPEQAEMSGLDIDTRSDIYSLGVLLYQLLTSKTPFDGKELLSMGIDEMRRTIREKEPMRPSTRLSQTLVAADVRRLKTPSSDKPATEEEVRASSRRLLQIKETIHLLKGDLDWIVMKALEKDRTRRYDTANGLAADIQRHLANEPVVARPPSTAYRFQKAFRRNKLIFAATGAVAGALLLGVVVSAWQAVRATRAKEIADAASQAALASEQKARTAEAGQTQLRRVAEAEAIAARRTAYASDINLSQQALAANNLGRAQALLSRQRPETGQQDLRDWEWRYLWVQSRADSHRVLLKTKFEVGRLGYDSSGRLLAWSAVNGMLRVMDLLSREIVLEDGLARWPKFAHKASLLAFAHVSPTNSTLVLWDTVKRRDIWRRPHSAQSVRGIAFLPKDDRLLTLDVSTTSGPDSPLCIVSAWDVASGKPLWRRSLGPLAEHDIHPFAVSPEGASIVVAMPLGFFRVLDADSGRDRFTVKATAEFVTSLAFSPDGKTILSGAGYTDSVIQTWDATTGTNTGSLHGHRSFVGGLTFTPDGSRMVSASGDQTIRVWDWVTRQPAGVLRGHLGEVNETTVSPDGRTLASGGKHGSIYVWDLTTPSRHLGYRTLPTRLRRGGFRAGGFIGDVATFTPDSRSIIGVEPSGEVVTWDANTLKETERFHGIGTNKMPTLVSPDARQIIRPDQEGRLNVSGARNGVEITNFMTAAGTDKMRFTENGKFLVLFQHTVTGSRGEVWDAETWKPSGSIVENRAHIRGVVTASIPNSILTVGADALHMFDLSRPDQAVKRLACPGNSFSGFAISPDGRTAAGSFESGIVQLWDLASLQPTVPLRGFLLGCHSVAFSPDGRRLAAGSNGNEAVRLWDVGTRQEVLTLSGEGSMFEFMKFSPDGRHLLALNVDGVVHLWSAPSWEEIATAEAKEKAGSKQP